MYYNEVRKGKGKEEEEYCKLDEERFLQKPISNVDLVNRINKIMMQIKRPEIPKNHKNPKIIFMQIR